MRGTGPSDDATHQLLALRAADCAARVLPYFEGKYPDDRRPREAIAAGRAWVRGEITLSEARAAAYAAKAESGNASSET
jgi:hypothetical protein